MTNKPDVLLEKYFPQSFFIIVFIFAYSAFSLFGFEKIFESDTAWHIAAGDLIRKLGTIPLYDSWSFNSDNDFRWFNMSWGWDIILSLIDNKLGLNNLNNFVALLFAFLVVVVCKNASLEFPAKKEVLIVIAYMSILGLINFGSARPQMATYIFCAIFHQIFIRVRLNGQYKLYFILPLLMIIWVNLHGGFIAGFTIIGAYAIAAFLEKNHSQLKLLILIGILCLIATLFNPLGIFIFEASYRTLGGYMENFIIEWAPVTFGSIFTITAFVIYFVMLADLRRDKICLAEKILVWCWFFAGLYSMRNVAMFIIFSSPMMARNLNELKTMTKLEIRPIRNKNILSVVFAIAIVSSMPFIKNVFELDKGNFVPHDFSPQIVDVIKRDYPNLRFMNSYNIGGYLIYYSHQKIKVFIDGRAGTAYKEEVMRDFIKFNNLEKDWPSILEKYNIQGLILLNGDAFTRLFDFIKPPNWVRVYSDNKNTLFIRKEYAKK